MTSSSPSPPNLILNSTISGAAPSDVSPIPNSTSLPPIRSRSDINSTSTSSATLQVIPSSVLYYWLSVLNNISEAEGVRSSAAAGASSLSSIPFPEVSLSSDNIPVAETPSASMSNSKPAPPLTLPPFLIVPNLPAFQTIPETPSAPSAQIQLTPLPPPSEPYESQLTLTPDTIFILSPAHPSDLAQMLSPIPGVEPQPSHPIMKAMPESPSPGSPLAPGLPLSPQFVKSASDSSDLNQQGGAALSHASNNGVPDYLSGNKGPQNLGQIIGLTVSLPIAALIIMTVIMWAHRSWSRRRRAFQNSDFQQNLTFAVIMATDQGPVVYYLPALSGLRAALTQQISQTIGVNISNYNTAGTQLDAQPSAETSSTSLGNMTVSNKPNGISEIAVEKPIQNFRFPIPPPLGDLSEPVISL
ncbi:hypothetical protein CEUSTIGMA_g2168.t1 [Chlamydomonas eustigma]|uniref:Uncharacterized protein n=1 Tax=Chlamydomonas eustigma TaxID=1157962 RepID=A0A250WV79_9CHLO|nr:hypothetical protein CEUSTIGMA_g2168.t1 [Chlamydomonas eustigma]|eukprot:GAX74721.1 hypothetical protein CEUSTIGMA_g2168.t1 [Chlamydomonas eustigma]